MESEERALIFSEGRSEHTKKRKNKRGMAGNTYQCRKGKDGFSKPRPRLYSHYFPRVLKFLFLRCFPGGSVCFGVPLLTYPSQSRPSARTQLHTQHVKPRVRSLFFETQQSMLRLSAGDSLAIPLSWRCVGGSHHESHVC